MIFKKIRKGHVDWQNFLCSTPARDYVFQEDAYEDQIDRAVEYIRDADCVLIGAGAGASIGDYQRFQTKNGKIPVSTYITNKLMEYVGKPLQKQI